MIAGFSRLYRRKQNFRDVVFQSYIPMLSPFSSVPWSRDNKLGRFLFFILLIGGWLFGNYLTSSGSIPASFA